MAKCVCQRGLLRQMTVINFTHQCMEWYSGAMSCAFSILEVHQDHHGTTLLSHTHSDRHLHYILLDSTAFQRGSTIACKAADKSTFIRASIHSGVQVHLHEIVCHKYIRTVFKSTTDVGLTC